MQYSAVNFFCENINKWSDIICDESNGLPLEDLASRFVRGRDVWIVQTFYNLRKLGFPVQISSRLNKDQINVVHYDDVLNFSSFHDKFVVSVRADRDPLFISNFEIVQNKSSIFSLNHHYIPHWPQPGIVKRDISRGEKLENIVYMGNKENIDEFYTSTQFISALDSLGMRLIIQDCDWWNYREADVVLAIRTGPPFFLSTKPASKLVNAWIAGCPAILSQESGYRELKESNDDYIEALCPEDVLTALKRLYENPDLVLRMRENGHRRATAFSVEAIAKIWERFLFHHVAREYEEWQRVSASSRKRRYLRSLLAKKIWGHWADGRNLGWASELVGNFRRKLALFIFNF